MFFFMTATIKMKRKLFRKLANKTKKINTPLKKNYRGGIRL